MWLHLWSSSAGCVTRSRCSRQDLVCHAGKSLHSWDLGSGMSFVRVCCTTWSFWPTLSLFLTSGWERREIWFQNHRLFYLFWSTKYPSATQTRCFISGETHHFAQPGITPSFPSRRTREPNNGLFPHLYVFPIPWIRWSFYKQTPRPFVMWLLYTVTSCSDRITWTTLHSTSATILNFLSIIYLSDVSFPSV